MDDRKPTIFQVKKVASPNRSGNRTNNHHRHPRATTKNFTTNTEGTQGVIFDFGSGKSNQFKLLHKELYDYAGCDALFKRAGMEAWCIEQLGAPNYTRPTYLQMNKEDPHGTGTPVNMDEDEKEEAKYIWWLNYNDHAHKVKNTRKNMKQLYSVRVGSAPS